MKARLIVQPKRMMTSVAHPVVWPEDREVPLGWEEIEIVTGTRKPSLEDHWANDPCVCGHDRKDHIRHSGMCLEKRSAGPCGCEHFRWAKEVEG